MKQILYFVLRSVLPVLLISSCWQPLRAQDTVGVKLKVEPAIVYVCGNDKEFILIFDIGPIKTSDSLIGYDLYFRYNPDLVTFSTVLSINTLTEQMNEITSTPIYTVPYPGMSQISAANLFTPVAGNKPLVAIRGTYKAECAGNAEIKVDSFEPFEEFKRRITSFENATISAKLVNKPSRILSLAFGADTVRTEDSVVKASGIITLPGERIISEGRIKFFGNENFLLDSVNVSDGFELVQIERQLDTVLAGWKRSTGHTGNKLAFTVTGNFIREGNAFLYGEPVLQDSCACVAGISGDSLELKFEKLSVGVDEAKTYSTLLAETGTTFVIESAKRLKTVEIWNYLGQKLAGYENINSSRIQLEIVNMNAGHYFVKIVNEDNTLEIKHLLYKF